MSFGSFLMAMFKHATGDVLGSSQDMRKYIAEYDRLSVPALKKEYSKLKKSSSSSENTNRKLAVVNILQKHRKEEAERLKNKKKK